MRQEKQQAIHNVIIDANANFIRRDIFTLSFPDFLFIASLSSFLKALLYNPDHGL